MRVGFAIRVTWPRGRVMYFGPSGLPRSPRTGASCCDHQSDKLPLQKLYIGSFTCAVFWTCSTGTSGRHVCEVHVARGCYPWSALCGAMAGLESSMGA